MLKSKIKRQWHNNRQNQRKNKYPGALIKIKKEKEPPHKTSNF